MASADITISFGRFSTRHAVVGPAVGRDYTREHHLNAHALVCQLVLQRLAEGQHEGLGGAVDAVQHLGTDCHAGRHVNDRAGAAFHELRRRSVGETHQGVDVYSDDVTHGFD